MEQTVNIIGAGLAGSEAALQLADAGFRVNLFEMRPVFSTEVHHTDSCAELVCSNSLKSMKEESAAGMLKHELDALGSVLYRVALACRVPAGGALAVDRDAFASAVTELVEGNPRISLVRGRVDRILPHGDVLVANGAGEVRPAGLPAAAVVVATGPLTAADLSADISRQVGADSLAFFDAAAPIVMADSLDESILFRQSRYEEEGLGDYLNAPFSKDEYERFISELLSAERVIRRDFETKDLFQACQPIEEIARKGVDAPRFGPLKPVGLVDPRTGRRPWAALQLRAENREATSYNLVGFQTNLTFPEQKRVFRMIPGLEHAEFARFGVMHRNTFVDAPHALDAHGRFVRAREAGFSVPVFAAGQVSGTEGYCEAIRSGLQAAISVASELSGAAAPALPRDTAYGALWAYATDPETTGYQPMHVNFGIMPPPPQRIKKKGERYAAYARRGEEALAGYVDALKASGVPYAFGGTAAEGE